MADEDIKKSINNYYGKPKDYESIFMKLKINKTDKLIKQIKYDIHYLYELCNNNMSSLSDYILRTEWFIKFFYICNFKYVRDNMISADQKRHMKQFEQKEFIDLFEQFKKYYNLHGTPKMFIIGSKYNYLDNRHQFFNDYITIIRKIFITIEQKLTTKINEKINMLLYSYDNIITFIKECLDANNSFVKKYKIIHSLFNNLIDLIPIAVNIPSGIINKEIYILLHDTVKNGLLVKLYNETNVIFKKTMIIIDDSKSVKYGYYTNMLTKYKNNKKISDINNITKEQLQQIISKITDRVNNTPRNSLLYRPKVIINNKTRMTKSNTINDIAIYSLYNNIKLRAKYILQSNGIQKVNVSPFFAK